MRVVILGATGTTGTHAVDGAIAAGHDVVAFVRNATGLAQRPGLTIMTGAVDDEAALRRAFDSADAVISCLGVRPSVQSLFRSVDFQQRTLPVIIAAINGAGVKRFVLMSSFGVGETRAKGSVASRVMHTVFGGRLFADKALAERALPSCHARWTAVYPVSLRKGPFDSAFELVPMADVARVPGLPVVTFATVAKVLVDLAGEEKAPAGKLLLTTRRGWRPAPH